jgi:protein tyrosine/serine phosphatase
MSSFFSSTARKSIAAGVLVVVALGVIWKEVLEDRVVPKRWGVVDEGSLFRSGQLHPALVESTLEDNGIDVIVNMNYVRLDKPEQAAQEVVADALGIVKERYPMLGDGTGDPEQYVLALERIHRALGEGDRVLVHCTAGAQRTGAVVALYRTLLQGRAVPEVIDEMESYDLDRVEDEPLLRFLDNNMRYITRRLTEEGVLEAPPDPLPRFLTEAGPS